MEDRYIGIISKLRAMRKALGASQSDLAMKIGKDQTFVSKVESGAKNLSLVEFLCWVDGLGISKEDASRILWKDDK